MSITIFVLNLFTSQFRISSSYYFLTTLHIVKYVELENLREERKYLFFRMFEGVVVIQTICHSSGSTLYIHGNIM